MADEKKTVLSARRLREQHAQAAALVRAAATPGPDVQRGKAVAIMRPGGCGKPTLAYAR